MATRTMPFSQRVAISRTAARPAHARSTQSTAVCTQGRVGGAPQPHPVFSARRSRRCLRCFAAQGEQGPEGESAPKEPAEDPSRPASAGRPAYDEDREFFQQEKAPSEPEKQKSGPGRKFGPLDGGVSGGQYGYGNVVDQAFKYLANADSFFLGGLFLVALFLALLAMGPPPSMNNDLLYR